jgi:hypothetical protein
MAISSIDDVLAQLRTTLASDLALGPLCTRVMLRTGVNLRAPRPDQLRDAALVGKVISTLSEMGYPL